MNMNHQGRELLELLKCQVCWEILRRPIFRCRFEHLMCQECFRRVTRCPTCREPLQEDLRSISMEQLADIVHSQGTINSEVRSPEVPQRNVQTHHETDLPELYELDTEPHHEERRTVRRDVTGAHCPLEYSCGWVGSRADVEQHVRQQHSRDVGPAPEGAFWFGVSPEVPLAAVLEFESVLFVVRGVSVPGADFTSHYVHVGHLSESRPTAEAPYRFKVRLDPDGAFYEGLVTDYVRPLEDLAASGGCLFFITQGNHHDEMVYSGTIQKSAPSRLCQMNCAFSCLCAPLNWVKERNFQF